jgi:tRNA(fMet)-specific endonuclease VapC
VTLSLDTNALVEIINGDRLGVRVHFRAAIERREEMVVSALVAHELRFGAQLSGRRSEIDSAEELLSTLPITPFTEDDSNGATAVRLALERSGRRIGAMDTLIAGQALSRGWDVVTANVNEFRRVAGLRVIDWTAAPETP